MCSHTSACVCVHPCVHVCACAPMGVGLGLGLVRASHTALAILGPTWSEVWHWGHSAGGAGHCPVGHWEAGGNFSGTVYGGEGVLGSTLGAV